METLYEFFEKNPKVALAFSGGVDSAYLLYAAVDAGVDVCAYYAKSDFQPEFELADAKRLAAELGAKMEIIYLDVLADPVVEANPADRCYYCKKHLFRAIIDHAHKDGYDIIMDGTNASDDPGDRPGVRALREYGVRSPLRDCGLTKSDIRVLSKEAGLFTWDKPAYACLATRIQTDQKITYKTLKAVETCEGMMMDLGFKDFRIRVRGRNALVQIREEDRKLFDDEEEYIMDNLGVYFRKVELDPVYRN
ncbi:MAG: ATP-dependent sacrificial sulfur transferase LarE [Clostridiales bacterium]|nr:ATP-dependent sacrificial sulfur transferase LarE [Clostridiales bacterium]